MAKKPVKKVAKKAVKKVAKKAVKKTVTKNKVEVFKSLFGGNLPINTKTSIDNVDSVNETSKRSKKNRVIMKDSEHLQAHINILQSDNLLKLHAKFLNDDLHKARLKAHGKDFRTDNLNKSKKNK